MHYDSTQTPKLYAACGTTHNMDLDLIKGFMVWFLCKPKKVENFVVSVFTVSVTFPNTITEEGSCKRQSHTHTLQN